MTTPVKADFLGWGVLAPAVSPVRVAAHFTGQGNLNGYRAGPPSVIADFNGSGALIGQVKHRWPHTAYVVNIRTTHQAIHKCLVPPFPSEQVMARIAPAPPEERAYRHSQIRWGRVQ